MPSLPLHLLKRKKKASKNTLEEDFQQRNSSTVLIKWNQNKVSDVGQLVFDFLIGPPEEARQGEEPYDEEIHEKKKSGRKTLKEYKITKGMFNFLVY